jgi:hypothetical protein
MDRRIVIGICGHAGAGKSTLAQMLCDLLGEDAYVAPFAGPLKSVAHSLGWDGRKDRKGRRLLQLLGTEVGRKCIHPDVWVRLWLEDAAESGGHVVADDVRFGNEAQAIRDLGGVIVRVRRRATDPGRFRLLLHRIGWRLHESERPDLIDEGHSIRNDGTLEELRASAANLLAAIVRHKEGGR